MVAGDVNNAPNIPIHSSNCLTISTCIVFSFIYILTPKKVWLFPLTTYISPKCFFTSFIISYITYKFYVITCCHPRTKQWYIVCHKPLFSQHTYHKGLLQNPNPLSLYRRAYKKTMEIWYNHKSTWSLIYIKTFPSFNTSHAAHTLGWPDTWCQQNPSWDSLRFSYTLKYLHVGMLQWRQKW